MSFSPQLSIEELLRFLLAQQSIALRQGFAVGQVQDMWRGRKLEETHGAWGRDDGKFVTIGFEGRSWVLIEVWHRFNERIFEGRC